jgi:hypothetical protein
MKTIILTFVLSLTIYSTQAQVLKSIGLKGGMSLSNQTFDYKTIYLKREFEYKPGLYSAISAEFLGFKHFSLVTDLGYLQKGMQFRMQETTPELPEGTGKFTTVKNTLGYLTFSPMLKGFYNINKFTAYALLGPRIDYLLNIDSKYYSPIYEESKKTIFGLNYGVGAAYNLNRISISMEFMAQPDLTPLLDKQPETNFSGFKVKSNTYLFNMGVSYRFR